MIYIFVYTLGTMLGMSVYTIVFMDNIETEEAKNAGFVIALLLWPIPLLTGIIMLLRRLPKWSWSAVKHLGCGFLDLYAQLKPVRLVKPAKPTKPAKLPVARIHK